MSVIELFVEDVKDNCSIDSINVTGSKITVSLSHESEEQNLMRACGRYDKIEKINENGDVYGTKEQKNVKFKTIG